MRRCTVCGRDGQEVFLFIDCGSSVDLTGDIGVINTFSASVHVDICHRPECREKVEETLRGTKRPKHIVKEG